MEPSTVYGHNVIPSDDFFDWLVVYVSGEKAGHRLEQGETRKKDHLGEHHSHPGEGDADLDSETETPATAATDIDGLE